MEEQQNNKQKILCEGLTFDDVLIVPKKSNVVPKNVNLSTKLTKELTLNVPIMTAAMDTVTESQMAIAMARQGGIGIIHNNLSIEEQAVEVDKVKRSENGVITDPFSLSPNHYVYEANELMAKYHISGVPVTENGKLIGIITNRDLRFETNHKKKIYEVMTREKLVTAPEGTTLLQAKEVLTRHKIEKLPLINDYGVLKGLITIKDIEKAIKYPNSAKDEMGRLLVGAAIGICDDCLERIGELIKAKVDVVVIENAHGHCDEMINRIKLIKATFPTLQIIAGNVATKQATIDLIEAGVDAVKVGIGPASISTTRVVAGVGVPQITAIMDCAEAAKPYGVPIIADGGLKYSGDITKAIAAGASVCMMGGIFAACEESPGKLELFQGRKFKVYRGMGSISTLESPNQDCYLQGNSGELVPEGVEGRVSYKGNAADVIFQLVGGLRSGMCYCGADNIETLQEDAQFIKITSAGLRESHPHDIQITKEAPNYSIEY